MAENTASDTERRGCLLAKGAAELAQHDPTVAGRSAETMRALLTLLRTEISAAQRHGDIDSAADPEQPLPPPIDDPDASARLDIRRRSPRRHPPRVQECGLTCTDEVSGKGTADCACPAPSPR
ncbi:TetR family transcriptional regulator C-terminal domain-containing protein [Streptomyces niphimycinicus]|uniref:TetR family transcriptional regulator C-terminal domain-containing protein n=1 Tax=Streptomyces niphimycinicus TaxID=2842201 RepID=UPI00209B024E|nr:hypothetical protein [Streptomyces niphimycinicus]